jgi:L-lactate dehydrogenase complex protein LldG
MDGNSKNEILESLRSLTLDPIPLPNLDGDWIEYDDPLAQFSEVLEAVGGTAVVVGGGTEINTALEEVPAYREADRVCSLVGGVDKANVDLETINDAHDLEDIDFFIAPAEFGVAENGAVWITDRLVKHRAAFFIAQHLAIVLPTRDIVSNMHQAYERLAFGERSFGLFLSGPSKTADIEQSLVIGAHGARSLTVLLVEG